jgi:hypothetical protein
MPDTETIAAYQAADLILINGADYAKWTTKVSLPRSRLVDSSRAFRDAYIRAAGTITHRQFSRACEAKDRGMAGRSAQRIPNRVFV